MMSSIIKVEETEFDTTEILDDNAIEKIGQEVENLIELLDDDDEDNDNDSTAIRYPGLSSKPSKRDHSDNSMLFSLKIIPHVSIKFD